MEMFFVSIRDAAKLTGISTFALRNGVRNGKIAHILCGTKYMINYPRLVAQLDEASKTSVQIN